MKILKSFAFAFNGLKICFSNETNFKVHILLVVIAMLFGIGFTISGTEWLAIFFCIALVLSMEMVNTAIEKLCDMVQVDFHPAIKKIKDIAAGAALVTATCSVLVAAIIFVPKIFHCIKLI